MDITVEPPGEDYAKLVSSVPDVLVHSSPEWARFVAAVCPAAEPIYFMAREGSQLVAALPAFQLEGAYGLVINSLPYFGSHGDLIVAPCVNRGPAVRALMSEFNAYASRENVTALNLVAHPFRSDDREIVAGGVGIGKVDDRIGQVSVLPRYSNREETSDRVLASCSQKTRNLVRKGLKSGFQIERSAELVDVAELHHHHVLGMERIAGTAKPFNDLIRLREAFGSACQVWIARSGGAFAGGLVTLTYRDWVEYFMPVAVEEHRNMQVLSALIFTAMVEYAAQGFRYWNWGGTWRTQQGVYRFKRGWGATDHIYGYYGFARRDVLGGVSTSELRAGYPSFYLLPFSSIDYNPLVSS